MKTVISIRFKLSTLKVRKRLPSDSVCERVMKSRKAYCRRQLAAMDRRAI